MMLMMIHDLCMCIMYNRDQVHQKCFANGFKDKIDYSQWLFLLLHFLFN